MITFCPYPIPVVTPLGDGFAIYINSNGMWENDEVCVAMKDGGQWRHFNTGQIKSWHNETYGIMKKKKSKKESINQSYINAADPILFERPIKKAKKKKK